jgi:hypothetical protein
MSSRPASLKKKKKCVCACVHIELVYWPFSPVYKNMTDTWISFRTVQFPTAVKLSDSSSKPQGCSQGVCVFVCVSVCVCVCCTHALC